MKAKRFGMVAVYAGLLLIGSASCAVAADKSPETLNKDFWSDCNAVQKSDDWKALQKKVGLTEKVEAAHVQSYATKQQVPIEVGTETQAQLATTVKGAVGPGNTFRANLSGGIPGLPGIYLGNNEASTRPSSPPGYTPVAGGSSSCRSK